MGSDGLLVAGGLGVVGACGGLRRLGFFEFAGLDAGVDEEAYADAEGDEAGGGAGEDFAHAAECWRAR